MKSLIIKIFNNLGVLICEIYGPHKAHIEMNVIAIIITGIFLNIGGYILSGYVPGRLNIDGSIRSICKNKCDKQYKDLNKEKKDLDDKLTSFNDRLEALKKLYSEPNTQAGIALSWASIEDLNKDIKKVGTKRDKYERLTKITEKRKINNADWDISAGLLIPIFINGLLSLFFAHLVLCHGTKTVFHNKDERIDISKIYWVAVLGVFFIYLSRTIYSSILTPEKTGFTLVSFCISPIGWVFKNISFFGGLMISLYPFALLMCLSNVRYEKRITLSNPIPNYGVGKYILFLHTWTIITCIGSFFPSILWLKLLIKTGQGGFSPIYLIDFAIAPCLGLIIITRLIQRAVSMRLQYQKAISNKTWKEIKKLDLPPDPTEDFLGERWFVLPASLTAILVGSWVLIELTGIDKLVFGFLK